MRGGSGTWRVAVPLAWRTSLTQHGLEPAAAGLLLDRHLARLVRRTKELNAEIGALLDAATGEQVGPDIVGTRLEVNLAPLFGLMQPGREYVSVHSHPSDCPFSRKDGFILFLYPRVRIVAVVGVRGTLHLLSRAAATPTNSQEELVAAHRAAHDALADEHASAVDSGRLSRRAADCWRADRVWRTIAPGVGLRYTRLARSEGW